MLNSVFLANFTKKGYHTIYSRNVILRKKPQLSGTTKIITKTSSSQP